MFMMCYIFRISISCSISILLVFVIKYNCYLLRLLLLFKDVSAHSWRLRLCLQHRAVCIVLFIRPTFRVSRRRREMYVVTRVCGYVCLSVCMCVCLHVRGRMPALLHGPGWNFGEWYGVPPGCALLRGFAIGAWFALLWHHNANAKC